MTRDDDGGGGHGCDDDEKYQNINDSVHLRQHPGKLHRKIRRWASSLNCPNLKRSNFLKPLPVHIHTATPHAFGLRKGNQ